MGLRMISCDEASRLISESMDHRPPLLERVNLRIHLTMCKVCMGYQKQMHLLRELVRSWTVEAVRHFTDKGLSQESKSRIKLHLRKFIS